MTTDDQGGELRRALNENRRLRAEIDHLRADNDRLHADNERLRERLSDLEAKLEAALRAGKRQSAPFSRGEPKANPKRPGRKSGEKHGRHGHRQPPEQVDETVAVEAPCGCPECGGELQEAGVEEQWQEEIVPSRPIRRRFVIQVRRCRRCGRRVRGHHPLQTSSASGAAAAQVGPEAVSMAARLHYELGLSMGKTAAVLHEVFGIRITRGGVAQALARLGERCGPTYGALVSCVRGGLLVVMDETGWRVGGVKAWLWVAVAELVTVYAIRRGRGFEEAAELIGKDYAGLLVRDGWGPYRGFKKALHQTCAAHLLRRCREMLESARGRGREIPKAVKAILLGALKLRDQRDAGEIAEADFQVELDTLEQQLRALLARPVSGADNPQGRLLRHLGREFDALFTFMRLPGVPATNWMAEQALRPAVVNRKVWGGNRTWNGGRHQERLMTVLRTARQQHREPITVLADLLRTPGVVAPLALPAPA
jgi:transposase